MTADHPQPHTSTDYTGPPVQEMVASHTLAREIMARHDGPCPVLDDEHMALLREWVADPARGGEMLLRGGLVGADGELTDNGRRSLVGHIMYKHGGDGALLTDGEVGLLRGWFEGGGAGGRV